MVICVMQPLCFCPSAAHSLQKQSVLNSHLSYAATNFWSPGWPLKTDLTVILSCYLSSFAASGCGSDRSLSVKERQVHWNPQRRHSHSAESLQIVWRKHPSQSSSGKLWIFCLLLPPTIVLCLINLIKNKQQQQKILPLLIIPSLGRFILSPQENHQGVLIKIQTSDLSIQWPTLYQLSHPDKTILCGRGGCGAWHEWPTTPACVFLWSLEEGFLVAHILHNISSAQSYSVLRFR
jgi:hypothetical protein